MQKYIFLFLICLVSCKGKIHEEFLINFTGSSSISNSDLLEISKIIKLQTDSTSLIGSIDKLEVHNDKIYVLDIFNMKSLFIYDMNGNLVDKIDRHGRGPGEFILPMSFVIDEQNDRIVLFDNGGSKAILYDIETLDYISEITLNFYFTKTHKLNNNFYAFYVPTGMQNEHNKHIFITDSAFNVIQTYEKIDSKTRVNLSGVNIFYSLNNLSYYFLPNNGNVNEFSENELHQKYKLSLHKPFFYTGMFSEIEDRLEYGLKMQDSDFVIQHSVYESNKHLSVTYIHQQNDYLGIYDKASNKTNLYNFNSIKDDLGIGRFSSPIGTYGELFISLIDFQNIDDEKLYRKLLKTDIDISNNPILLLYEYK